ncbi:MAG: DegT/DnrJ/EryC1/StrS family aminotransferase [Solirubrobacterales bacterium]
MSNEVEQLPVFDVQVTEEDMREVEDALRSGWLTMGERTERFEREFAESIGTSRGVALSSCTAALHLACLALDIGPGDEVIVPSVTFAATANAVRYTGARPVFADIVSEGDLGIDVDHVESLVNERTKAVIPVHYAGYAVEIDRLAELCERRGIGLIEDAAHAPSACQHRDGPRLGSIGAMGCFSFFPNKVLGVGEGGALTTDSDELADRIVRLRSQGMTAVSIDRHRGKAIGYDVLERGYNYRFDDPRAALLLSRFHRLEDELVERRAAVARYRELLADVPGLTIPYADFDLDCSSCYLMGVLAPDAATRRTLRERLASEHGVQTTMYPAVHLFTAYIEAYGEVSLPVTERVADGLFSIPLFPHITEAQQERVAAALRESVAFAGVEG